jgi:hypothetical protein
MPLDPRHLALCDAARRAGLPATYTGSGGAVVGVCPDPERLERLRGTLRALGSEVIAVG